MRNKFKHVDPDPRWINRQSWRAVRSASTLAAPVAVALILAGFPWSATLLVATPMWAVWFYLKLPRWPGNKVHYNIGLLDDLVRLFECLKPRPKAEDAERIRIPLPDLLRIGGALTATSATTRSR